MSTLIPAGGWGGRRLVFRSTSLLSGGVPLYPPHTDPASGYSVFTYAQDAGVGLRNYDVKTFAIVEGYTGIGLSAQAMAVVPAGGVYYLFVAYSTTTVRVYKYTLYPTDFTYVTTFSVANYEYNMTPVCGVWDGGDYLYVAICNSINTSIGNGVFRFQISTSAVTLLKAITLGASYSITTPYGMGISSGILYFALYNVGTYYFYSLDVGGVTLTLVDSSSSIIVGYKGYNVKGTTLYNAARSASWALTEAPSGMFILDDVAGTPKLIYTGSAAGGSYREALGAVDQRVVALSSGQQWKSNFIFPFRSGGTPDYTAGGLMAVTNSAQLLHAVSLGREVS